MEDFERAARPGRSCPPSYRYSPVDIGRNVTLETDCLYVIDGLYGNLPALDVLMELAQREPHRTTLVFNGDFNWFNVDAASFERLNGCVLEHTALRGNVETEIAGDDTAAGCGCAYPDFVSDGEVERSNQILDRLRQTARAFPALRSRLGALPMHATAVVGATRIAIVHGDCVSLAGWGLSHEALGLDEHQACVEEWFAQAQVRIIASSHSCLPVLMDSRSPQGTCIAINNGAAGMPNFRDTQYGVITRIGVRPAADALYGARIEGVHVDALPLHYDHARWEREFLANWPPGSPAHKSYYRRIMSGPAYTLVQVARGAVSFKAQP